MAVLEESFECGFADGLNELLVFQHFERNRHFGRQPPRPAVARGVDAEKTQQAIQWTVPAGFEALEIAPHIRCFPTRILSQAGDVIPILVLRVDEDHGVMRGASAEAARPRIKYT